MAPLNEKREICCEMYVHEYEGIVDFEGTLKLKALEPQLLLTLCFFTHPPTGGNSSSSEKGIHSISAKRQRTHFQNHPTTHYGSL